MAGARTIYLLRGRPASTVRYGLSILLATSSGRPVMNCPSCGAVLTRTHRRGVEIDTCPDCRGVWLDRGELDKILSLEAVPAAAPPRPAGPPGQVTSRQRGRRSTWRELFD